MIIMMVNVEVKFMVGTQRYWANLAKPTCENRKSAKGKREVSSRALVHYLKNCYRELNALVSALVALPITLNGSRPFCLNVFIIGHPAP